MRSVIVIFADEPDFKYMADVYGKFGSVSLQSSKHLIVEGEWGWFAIEIDPHLEQEFSDEERGKIEPTIPKPIYAQLQYSSSSGADLAINLMPATDETMIDNDHGEIRFIGEVRNLISAGIEWQTIKV